MPNVIVTIYYYLITYYYLIYKNCVAPASGVSRISFRGGGGFKIFLEK